MAIKCAVCGHENPDYANVCQQCGSDFERKEGADQMQPPPPPPRDFGHAPRPYGEPPMASAPQGWQNQYGGEVPQSAYPPGDLPDPTTYLVLSILMTFCCCQIAGIPAIVFSALAMGAKSSGNYADWRKWCNYAKISLVVGLVLGLLVYAIVFLFQILAVSAGSSGGW